MTVQGKFIRTRAFFGFLNVIRTLQDRVAHETRTIWSDWYNRHEHEIQDCYEKGMSPKETFAAIGAE